jgi:hypothetical protein
MQRNWNFVKYLKSNQSPGYGVKSARKDIIMSLLDKTIYVKTKNKRSYTISNDRYWDSLKNVYEKVREWCFINYEELFPWDAVNEATTILWRKAWFRSLAADNQEILSNLVGYEAYKSQYPDSIDIADFEKINEDILDEFQNRLFYFSDAE